MNKKQQEILSELYNSLYNETAKPLISLVESKFQEFPLPLFNEIRAFNDHIARCYQNHEKPTDKYIYDQLEKAKSHLKRIIFDCHKYLNVFFYDKIMAFEKETKNIDLKQIGDTDFYHEYKKFYDDAINYINEAKNLETVNQEKSFDLFQRALVSFFSLEKLIYNNRRKINEAKIKRGMSLIGKALIWLLSALISGIISSQFFPNIFNIFFNWIKTLF